jgi:hypothetical protein
MPIPRLAKYPRISRLLYALSAATRPGKRLGRPLPPFLIAPPSINRSNTVHSWVCPGVSSNTTGLPLPSHRTCSLVEYPPWLLPNASFSGLVSELEPELEFGSPFLPRLHAGEHARRSYQRNVSPTRLLLGSWHLSAPLKGCGPRYQPHAICRSEKKPFYMNRIVQVSPPRERLFSLSTGCH